MRRRHTNTAAQLTANPTQKSGVTSEPQPRCTETPLPGLRLSWGTCMVSGRFLYRLGRICIKAPDCRGTTTALAGGSWEIEESARRPTRLLPRRPSSCPVVWISVQLFASLSRLAAASCAAIRLVRQGGRVQPPCVRTKKPLPVFKDRNGQCSQPRLWYQGTSTPTSCGPRIASRSSRPCSQASAKSIAFR